MFVVGLKEGDPPWLPGAYVLGASNSCVVSCAVGGEEMNVREAFLFLYEMQEHIKVLN